jgi:hypothetical protein
MSLFIILALGSYAVALDQDTLVAREVAQAWLALADSGQYGKAYDQYAARIKISVSREGFIRYLAGRRGPDPATAFEILSDASGSELPKQ